MRTNGDDMAFAIPGGSGAPGLTKRELAAFMAMQGLLSAVYSDLKMLNEFTADKEGGFRRYKTGAESISQNAVHYADALIEALNKEST